MANEQESYSWRSASIGFSWDAFRDGAAQQRFQVGKGSVSSSLTTRSPGLAQTKESEVTPALRVSPRSLLPF
jgi:hypothetical protein